MIMYEYETTGLNSLRAIIGRVGIGEASLSISPYLQFCLKGLILFSSWENTVPAQQQEVFQIDTDFS